MMEMGVSLLWILSTTDLVIYCPVPYLLLTWRGVKNDLLICELIVSMSSINSFAMPAL
jgi:hypothetical protein